MLRSGCTAACAWPPSVARSPAMSKTQRWVLAVSHAGNARFRRFAERVNRWGTPRVLLFALVAALIAATLGAGTISLATRTRVFEARTWEEAVLPTVRGAHDNLSWCREHPHPSVNRTPPPAENRAEPSPLTLPIRFEAVNWLAHGCGDTIALGHRARHAAARGVLVRGLRWGTLAAVGLIAAVEVFLLALLGVTIWTWAGRYDTGRS
jgi:hypothetical protein